MDTSSLPAADVKSSLQTVATSRISPGPGVIQEYKQRVKGMVALMLRLSHEGASQALKHDLESAASALVSTLHPHQLLFTIDGTTYIIVTKLTGFLPLDSWQHCQWCSFFFWLYTSYCCILK